MTGLMNLAHELLMAATVAGRLVRGGWRAAGEALMAHVRAVFEYLMTWVMAAWA